MLPLVAVPAVTLWLVASALVPVGPPATRAAAASSADAVVPPGMAHSACPASRRPVRVDDPRLAELWRVAAGFDRARHGFSVLPRTGAVILEEHPRDGSAVIHTCQMADRVYRTIHFRGSRGAVRWVGEQQAYRSGRTYEDRFAGTLQEEIVLDYEIEPVAGFPLNRLNIQYRGPATGGAAPPASPSPEQAWLLLRAWGF